MICSENGPIGKAARRASIQKIDEATRGTNPLGESDLSGDRCGPVGNSGVSIMLDMDTAIIRKRPVRWAAEELRATLASRGVSVEIREGFDGELPACEKILVTRSVSSMGRELLRRAGLSVPNVPESLALVRGQTSCGEALLAMGSDERGVVYALLELADRSRYAKDPLASLDSINSVVEQPATPVRSVTRLFTSELEDKPWFYDKSFWRKCLSMLISQRFNRFSLTLGLGYDYPRHVLDSYFYFPYPFLVVVPGYRVTAEGLPDEERERNLDMLRWISDEAATRGGPTPITIPPVPSVSGQSVLSIPPSSPPARNSSVSSSRASEAANTLPLTRRTGWRRRRTKRNST